MHGPKWASIGCTERRHALESHQEGAFKIIKTGLRTYEAAVSVQKHPAEKISGYMKTYELPGTMQWNTI